MYCAYCCSGGKSRFLRILLAVPLLIPLLLVGLLIPAGLHKPLLVIRLLLIRLLGVRLLITLLLIALPIRLLITLLLVALLTVWLLITSVWLLVSLLTIGLLIIRIPLLTILRLPIAVLRRVALTIGIIGRVAAIRGIALRRRIIACENRAAEDFCPRPRRHHRVDGCCSSGFLSFLPRVCARSSLPRLRTEELHPPARGLSRKRLNRALHDNASYSIAQKNGL